MSGLPRAILVLEGGNGSPQPNQFPRVPLHPVSGPLGAAAALARLKPEVIIFNPGIRWHRAFLDTLPQRHRPILVAVGEAPVALHVDEWLKDFSDSEELLLRIKLARERVWQRGRDERRAFVDSLTSIPNRRAVIRALVREAARARRGGKPPALALVDLDNFKAINDECGHDEGDRVLRKAALALQSVVRGDELCGRIGGDEFALVLAGGADPVERVARRAQKALDKAGVRATVAAAVLKPHERLQSLYRRADALLRDAKRRRILVRAVQAVPSEREPLENDWAKHVRPVAFRAKEVSTASLSTRKESRLVG
ncbi:MAG: GGDEF domain-containing protein [Myxococcales bacterium]